MTTALRRLQETESWERRSRARFPVIADLQYTVPGLRWRAHGGQGRTVNISSGGVLFESSNPPALGAWLKLSIAWPVNLQPQVGLKLVATGRIVRTDGLYVAVEFRGHEFHTRNL